MTNLAMEFECCVVTGGRGFLARWSVQKLLQSGRWIVKIVDLDPAIILDGEEQGSIVVGAPKFGRVFYHGANLSDKTELLKGESFISAVAELENQHGSSCSRKSGAVAVSMGPHPKCSKDPYTEMSAHR